MRQIEYVRIGDNKLARRVKEDKRLRGDYRSVRDRIFSFEGEFETMITITLKNDCIDGDKIKTDLADFQSAVKKHIGASGHYIGVLEHGESRHRKNPIEPHYHYLITGKWSQKEWKKWKAKCGDTKGWVSFEGMWFDVIKKQRSARAYVAKYAKGKHLVKDYGSPPEGWEDVDLWKCKSSHGYQKQMRSEVSFKVDGDVLELFGVGHYNYLNMNTLRLKSINVLLPHK